MILSFCFTAPVQNIPTPIIYTNGDSMPVTLQIFVNEVFVGPRNQFITEKIDEFFYQPLFHAYPTPTVRFPQKPALQHGTFTFPINFKFEKKGLYNTLGFNRIRFYNLKMIGCMFIYEIWFIRFYITKWANVIIPN